MKFYTEEEYELLTESSEKIKQARNVKKEYDELMKKDEDERSDAENKRLSELKKIMQTTEYKSYAPTVSDKARMSKFLSRYNVRNTDDVDIKEVTIDGKTYKIAPVDYRDKLNPLSARNQGGLKDKDRQLASFAFSRVPNNIFSDTISKKDSTPIISVPNAISKDNSKIAEWLLQHEVGHHNTMTDAPSELAKDALSTNMVKIDGNIKKARMEDYVDMYGVDDSSESAKRQNKNLKHMGTGIGNRVRHITQPHANKAEVTADLYADQHVNPKSGSTKRVYKALTANGREVAKESVRRYKEQMAGLDNKYLNKIVDNASDRMLAAQKKAADSDVIYRSKNVLDNPNIDKSVYAEMNPHDPSAIHKPRHYGDDELSKKQKAVHDKINASTEADEKKNPEHKPTNRGTQTVRHDSVELTDTAMTLIESGNNEAAQILIGQILNEDAGKKNLINRLITEKNFTPKEAKEYADKNYSRLGSNTYENDPVTMNHGVPYGDTAEGMRNEKIEEKLKAQANNGTRDKWQQNDNGTWSLIKGTSSTAHDALKKRGMDRDTNNTWESMEVKNQTGTNSNANRAATEKKQLLKTITADPNSADAQSAAYSYSARSGVNAGTNQTRVDAAREAKGKELTTGEARAADKKSNLLYDKNGNAREMTPEHQARIDAEAQRIKNGPIDMRKIQAKEPRQNVQQGQPQQNVQQRPVAQQNTQPVQQQAASVNNTVARRRAFNNQVTADAQRQQVAPVQQQRQAPVRNVVAQPQQNVQPAQPVQQQVAPVQQQPVQQKPVPAAVRTARRQPVQQAPVQQQPVAPS